MQQAVHWWLSTYERLVKSQKFFSSYLTQEDMSRLGRNYLQVGFYTEMLFPQKGVRFIAVNDNVDSANGGMDNDFTPLRNLFKNIAHSGNVFHCFTLIRHREQTRLQDYSHP